MCHTVGRILAVVHFFESAILVTLLVAIIGLSVADIFMRNFFNSGITIAAPLVRILVLWLGLLGALFATRSGKHITVDVLARLLPPGLQRVASGITSLFSAAVCLLIAWHGTVFVRDTWSYNDVLLDNFPAWIVQAIIPVSFCLIALRFSAHSVGHFFITNYHTEKTAKSK